MDFNYRPGSDFQQEKVEATFKRLMLLGEQKDLAAIRKELDNVIFILSKLVDLIHDKQIRFPIWMKHSEVLFVKFALHTSSLNQLGLPVPFSLREDHTTVNAFDRSSLYVVARAQLEAFLTFYYLILSPETNEQGEFSDMIYELSGLCNRHHMPATLNSSLEQKRKDAERIAELRQKIENHTYFTTIDGQLKQKIRGRKPPARLFNGWEDLIKESHLKDNIFVPRWKYYSGYAHSEYISSLQLPSSFSDPVYVVSDVCQTLEIAIMTICVTIIELLNLIPVLQKEYSVLWSEDQRITIYFYSKTALKPNIQINRQININ